MQHQLPWQCTANICDVFISVISHIILTKAVCLELSLRAYMMLDLLWTWNTWTLSFNELNYHAKKLMLISPPALQLLASAVKELSYLHMLSCFFFNISIDWNVGFLFFCFFSHATLGLFKKLQQRAPKSLRRYYSKTILVLFELWRFFQMFDFIFHWDKKTFAKFPWLSVFHVLQVGVVWAS